MSQTTNVRIPPLDRADWSEEYRVMLDSTVAARREMEVGAPFDGRPVRILHVLAHHSGLMEAFLRWSDALAHGRLSRRHHEMLALRVICILRSDFEYGHHIAYARGAGLSDEEIQGLHVGPHWPNWSEFERALVSAADECVEGHVISDETWQVLAGDLAVDQLIEVPMTVGQYTMLCFVAESLGVELEDGYDHLPPASAVSSPAARPR